MFILWLKTALFLLSLFVDSHKILRTCDLPGHAVSVLGQSACMNQNSAQVKNNSFFGLEKQSTSFPWPPPASCQRDWETSVGHAGSLLHCLILGRAVPTLPPSSLPVLPMWGYSTVHMKITCMSQFIISPEQMRGLEADQSRGVSWWVHSSKARDGCFSLALAIVPGEKNNSLLDSCAHLFTAVLEWLQLLCSWDFSDTANSVLFRLYGMLAAGDGGLRARQAHSCAEQPWAWHWLPQQFLGAGAHSSHRCCGCIREQLGHPGGS